MGYLDKAKISVWLATIQSSWFFKSKNRICLHDQLLAFLDFFFTIEQHRSLNKCNRENCMSLFQNSASDKQYTRSDVQTLACVNLWLFCREKQYNAWLFHFFQLQIKSRDFKILNLLTINDLYITNNRPEVRNLDVLFWYI